MRGVIRQEDGTIKKFVADVGKSPMKFTISSSAMRAARGLAETLTGVVHAAPLERIVSTPMHGLAVKGEDPFGETTIVLAHRIFILVMRTQESELELLQDDNVGTRQQSFHVKSENAKCLLSVENQKVIDLKCYCSFDSVLNFRLDMESAWVSVTSVTEKDGRLEAAVDAMEKVRSDELEAIRNSLQAEWKTALTNMDTTTFDPSKPPAKEDYWNDPKRKVARLISDPKTPTR